MAMWLHGYVAMRLCGCVATWLCGNEAMWLLFHLKESLPSLNEPTMSQEFTLREMLSDCRSLFIGNWPDYCLYFNQTIVDDWTDLMLYKDRDSPNSTRTYVKNIKGLVNMAIVISRKITSISSKTRWRFLANLDRYAIGHGGRTCLIFGFVNFVLGQWGFIKSKTRFQKPAAVLIADREPEFD